MGCFSLPIHLISLCTNALNNAFSLAQIVSLGFRNAVSTKMRNSLPKPGCWLGQGLLSTVVSSLKTDISSASSISETRIVSSCSKLSCFCYLYPPCPRAFLIPLPCKTNSTTPVCCPRLTWTWFSNGGTHQNLISFFNLPEGICTGICLKSTWCNHWLSLGLGPFLLSCRCKTFLSWLYLL